MSVHFTEPQMVQLVEIYKEYDCLWNMKHEQYRDKGARQTAYNQIAETLNIPNLRAKDIPNKIKNLRSSYYQEIKRVRRSVRLGGKVYRPKVIWFSTVDSFLRPFRHEREFISKEPMKGNKKVDTNFLSLQDDDGNRIQKEIKQIDSIAERITPSNKKNGMVQLAEIYKEYDCLWNMKHEQYRDKGARQTAYNQIAETLNIPNLRAKDIPNKIKNLRSSYYHEIKRVRRSVRLGGKVYKPKMLWFSTLDSFIRPFRHEREFVLKRPMNGNKKVDTNFLSLQDDDGNRIQKEIKQIDSIAERIKPSNKKIEDEFDSFGKYIASSLRSMPQEFSIITRTELQKTISDIQLKIVMQVNTGNDHFNRAQSPSGSASTSSNYENQRTEYLSPTSDSCISTIKIEYDIEDE